MATVIQFMPEWRPSLDEQMLVAFMKIRDPEIKSGLYELIEAIVREQVEEPSR